jgi:HEAT repeat protein
VGILDIFGGGSPEEKARKLKPKVTQKYGDPSVRQKAITQLGDMKSPEAVRALLARFTITVEPGSIDADEKDHVFEVIKAFGQGAVEPVKDFLFRSDAASSWAVRILEALVTEEELVSICLEALRKIGNEYTRDPEKKVVLVRFLTGKSDGRIAPALVPFLEDPSDDVKLAVIASLGPLKHEGAREPLLKLLTSEETARRVKSAVVPALVESEFGVQGYREKVEQNLSDPYFVDKSGLVKKRG